LLFVLFFAPYRGLCVSAKLEASQPGKALAGVAKASKKNGQKR